MRSISPCKALFLGAFIASCGGWTMMGVSSFCLVPSLPSIHTMHHSELVTLYAKKQKSKKSSKKSSSVGGGGSGFGSSPTNTNQSNQVRSVSGFSGSGTKPLRVAANTFDALQTKFGVDCINDVYVQSPLHDETIFWFVGKVAQCLSECHGDVIPTPCEAVISQKRLILEYAKRELRPQTMGGIYEKALQLWLAPGNSEMDVVQNKITLEQVTGSTSSLRDGFQVADVGFNPEIYVGEEVQKGGLRVTRDAQGRPTKPVFDINESA